MAQSYGLHNFSKIQFGKNGTIWFQGWKEESLFDWAWRLTLRARGVRVGVGLRGVGLRGLGWWLGPRRGPILWHVPGVPRTPGPAPRSPASTRRGPVAPWSGRRRPTCDHQPHKICVTDHRVTPHLLTFQITCNSYLFSYS